MHPRTVEAVTLGSMRTAVLPHVQTAAAASWLTVNALAMQGAAHVVRQVLATDGIRGLYRGFGIVVVGVIPARGVSLPRCSCVPATCCRRRSAQFNAYRNLGPGTTHLNGPQSRLSAQHLCVGLWW